MNLAYGMRVDPALIALRSIASLPCAPLTAASASIFETEELVCMIGNRQWRFYKEQLERDPVPALGRMLLEAEAEVLTAHEDRDF